MKAKAPSGILSTGVVGPILCVAALLTGCVASERALHGYIMRGVIIDAQGTDVYLCIGEKDGAKIGQELVVYKNIKNLTLGPVIPGYRRRFKRENTGWIRIVEIVDEHFARAVIVTGEASEGSIAELEER